MKTNIIANNTNMKTYVKYLCAVLLLIGTSVSAWADNCTYKVWDGTRKKWEPYVVQDQNWVVPPAPEKSGYTFVGWHIYDGKSTEWPTNPSTGNYKWDDGNADLNARIYYVHPIPNSAGNDDNKHTAKQGYTEMFAIYRPDASSPVSGWGEDVDWTAPSETQITITFKPNGGSPNSDKTQTILSNTPTHLSSSMFTRDGYEFAGWGTSSSFSSLTYADCEEVTFTSNQTLYAEWVDDANYSIRYDLSGMTKVDGLTEVEKNAAGFEANFSFNTNYGTPVTYKVEMQDFYSSYSDITDDCDYENGYLLVMPASGITGNIVVTISASEKNKFTVSYNKNGATSGSAPSTQTNLNKNSSVTVRSNTGSLTKTGYTFSGWTTRSDGSGTTYAAGSGSFTITSDVVLYAKWNINQYNVAVAEADNVTITATPASESAIAENANRDVNYAKEVTLAYSSLVSPHEFREWKVTKTSDGTDVTMAVLDDKTAASAVLTVPTYGVTVSIKLTGDYIAWCPDPAIELSGEIAVTAFNGRGIMAAAPLHVAAVNLNDAATVTLSSNNAAVYFSADRNANFLKDAPNCPTTTLNLTASDGMIDTDVYVHYKPSSAGDGSASEVTITATWTTPEPDLTEELAINVRSLPEKFVIATKVGGSWYALPANMGTATTPDAVAIEVNETTMTATAPNTCTYTLWPVLTHETASSDRYALYEGKAYGERVRPAAVNGERKGLWANNSKSSNVINNSNAITGLKSTGGAANEWKIETTVGATGNEWKYTLQTDQDNNQNYLNLYRTMQWGTYSSGLTDGVYFLPVTEVTPFEMKVVEWYPTKVLVYTTETLSSPTVKINGSSVTDPTCTGKGTNMYEIGNLTTLEDNATKSLTVTNSGKTCTKTIPVIISRGTKSISDAPFTTLTKDVYKHADLVVRDGAVLTVNGTQAENEFFDVTIYPTSKISVPETNANSDPNKLSVHSITFFGGIDEIYDGSAYTLNKYGVPELSLKGTIAKKTVNAIDYVMRVDLRQMYALALPYNVALEDITYWDGTAMTPGEDLYVSAYDGQRRANREKAWVYEEDFEEEFGTSMLKAGVGYTISAELQSGFGDGVGGGYSIIRMPMATNISVGNSEAAKTVAVEAYVNTKGAEVTDNHKGWNFVGNPYMVTINGNTAGGKDDTKLIVGHLVPTDVDPWDGTYTWENDGYRYVTIPSDDGKDNWQSKWADVTLKPFKNFFIQVGTAGDLAFALASRQAMPAMYARVIEREVEFEIILNSETRQDHMGMLIAEKYTPAYEINADLEKMESTLSVYTLTEGNKLAYNALSPNDAMQPIPVGYIANESGNYTFRLDERSNVDEIRHIWLTDYDLNEVVDLLEKTYDFTTDKGRNETRFALTVDLKAENEVPTNISDVVAGEDKDAAVKFIWHDKMYILNKGIIYDATGKRVNVINK